MEANSLNIVSPFTQKISLDIVQKKKIANLFLLLVQPASAAPQAGLC
jgi:hypothetical protein